MQKWEYAMTSVTRRMGFSDADKWDVDWGFPDEMGDEGWELVSAIPIANVYDDNKVGVTTSIYFVFKRPKE